MVTASPQLEQLSGAAREKVEAWLFEFQRTWQDGRLKHWVGQLPPAESAMRLPALIEMVRIDLEHNRRLKRPARIEAYLKMYPELGTPETVAAYLIAAEFEVRRLCGDSFDPAEVARRFPAQADEVRRLLEQAPQPPATPTVTLDVSNSDSTGGMTAAAAAAAAPPVPTPSQPKDPTAPRSFGRYLLLHSLGEGGMGDVYLAEDTELKRRVALKIPKLDSNDPEVRERFLREARAMARLEHRNICPVHDVGVVDGMLYLTMKFVEGKRLSDRLDDGPLPPDEAALLVQKLAQTLQRPHEHGIIHRDLKPSNVIIDHEGEPVVLDFGVARLVEPGEPSITKTGAVVGTPAYMSPEQVMGEHTSVGPVSDVYSLGVILYQCLTGRLPFDARPVHAAIAQILTREPVPPSQLRPGLDPKLEAICLKAMAKKAESRYPSMSALAAALAEYRSRTSVIVPVTPVGPSGKMPSSPFLLLPTADIVRRRKVLLAAGAGALGILLVVLLVVAMWDGKGDPGHAQANDDAKKKKEEIPVPDGGKKAKKEPPRHTPGRPLRPLRVFAERHVGPVNALSLSADGKRLASAGEDNTLRVWDVTAGKQVLSATLQVRSCKSIALSPRGDYLLACDGPANEGTGSVFRWDVRLDPDNPEAGPVDPKAAPLKWWPRPGDFTDACSVALSPDGRKALIGDWVGQVRLVDAGTQDLLRKYRLSDADKDNPGANPIGSVAFSADGKRFLATELYHRTLQLWPAVENARLCKLPVHHLDGRWPSDWGAKLTVGMLKERIVSALSPDGALALTSSKDKFLRLWDLNADPTPTKAIRQFDGHDQYVLCAAFSPDGRLAASGSQDGTVRLWEVATGVELSRAEAGQDVTCVAFTLDGGSLVSAGGRGTLRVWAVPEEYLTAPKGAEDKAGPGVGQPK